MFFGCSFIYVPTNPIDLKKKNDFPIIFPSFSIYFPSFSPCLADVPRPFSQDPQRSTAAVLQAAAAARAAQGDRGDQGDSDSEVDRCETIRASGTLWGHYPLVMSK